MGLEVAVMEEGEGSGVAGTTEVVAASEEVAVVVALGVAVMGGGVVSGVVSGAVSIRAQA